jgi:hypothetical protein
MVRCVFGMKVPIVALRVRSVLMVACLFSSFQAVFRCAADRLMLSEGCIAVAADVVATPHSSNAAADTMAVCFLIGFSPYSIAVVTRMRGNLVCAAAVTYHDD